MKFIVVSFLRKRFNRNVVNYGLKNSKEVRNLFTRNGN